MKKYKLLCLLFGVFLLFASVAIGQDSIPDPITPPVEESTPTWMTWVATLWGLIATSIAGWRQAAAAKAQNVNKKAKEAINKGLVVSDTILDAFTSGNLSESTISFIVKQIKSFKQQGEETKKEIENA